MIISLRTDGTAVMLEPSHVYQGSNVANVYVMAPFPNTTVLQIGFTLPDGTSTSAPMTYVQDSENNLIVWQYTIAAAITNVAGAASVSVTATTTTGQIIASQSIPFTIEETTLPVLPDVPSQDEWELITKYIQQNSAAIATLQGQISAIEADVATANENAATALTTAQSAETTANQAAATANGFAAQIAEANTNASAAVTTANQAASEVGQYTQQIAEANANASEALDKATQAEQTVGTFETALDEANTNASNAVSTANAAQQTANQAASEVGQYTQQIETANSNASAAVATANGAATTAQQAESTAQSAQTGVNNLVNGTTSAGNANQLGGVAASSYAQLSQVVRTDTNQELSENQKHQALVNLSVPITDVVKLSRDTKILLYTWDKTAFPGSATCFKIDMYGAGDYGTAGIATYVVKGNNGSICGYLINDNNTYGYCPTIYTYANGNDINLYIEVPDFVDTCSLVITQDYAFKNNVINSIPLLNQAVTDYSGTLISSSRNEVIIGYAPVFAVDPTTLAPSTDNGWTEGNPASILPSNGLYWVAAVGTSPSVTLNAWRTLLSYDGSQGDCLMPTNQTFTVKCEATTSGFTFTEQTSGSSIIMTTVWYKQIL